MGNIRITPFFSVIIPTYNRAGLIGRAINSILDQSFLEWECIIVDDGSEDNTAEIIKRNNDRRIICIRQEHAGRSIARNTGIEIAKGEYICFLDSDDYFLPERLTSLHKEIVSRNKPCAFFYTATYYEKKSVLTKALEPKNNLNNIYDFILKASIANSQVCIHRDILKKYKFDSRFDVIEDMELWLRIASEFPIIYSSGRYTVVMVDHDDRSVNERKYDHSSVVRNALKFIFSRKHPGRNASAATKRQVMSNYYFRTARVCIYRSMKIKAIWNLIKSILISPLGRQTKHKIYLIINLSLNKEIKEYSG